MCVCVCVCMCPRLGEDITISGQNDTGIMINNDSWTVYRITEASSEDILK